MPKRGYVQSQQHRDALKHAMLAHRVQQYIVEDRGYETPCWVWRRSLNGKGYPYMSLTCAKVRKSYRAHRYYYERAKGPIPKGLELDHLCRVRECVNPDHMEPVTHKENIERGHAARRA